MPAQTGYYISTITALKAIDASIRTQGYTRLVGETSSWYMFRDTSTATPDNVNIVQPLTGIGRWHRTGSIEPSASSISDLAEYIDDRVGSLVSTSPTIESTYVDASNQLSLTVRDNSITDSKVNSLSISKVTNLSTELSDKAGISHVHSPGAVTGLQEYIEDIVGGFLQNGSNISLNYNDNTNTLTISGTPVPLSIKDEGTLQGTATSLNFTGSRISTSVSAGEATVTVTTPEVEIALQAQGVVKGNAKTLNFTGSAVNNISLTGDVATIDLTGGNTSGTSVLQEQNYVINSTGSIPYNSQATYSFTPELTSVVRSITTNYAARVRVYIDSTYASNDILRPVSTELAGEHGCLLEVVTTPTNLTVDLAPPVLLYKKNSSTPLSITISNLDVASRVFTVTLTSLKW